MSIIVASGEAISRSPINSSKSKQMYSFTKSGRFGSNNAVPRVEYKFYDLPSVLNKRTTTFGYGQKYDFTKTQKGMNALFYDSKSDFDQAHPYLPRYSFGIGRDKYDKVYYESNKFVDKAIPGPGKYDYLKTFGSDSVKYSMSPKSKPTGKAGQSPGPGAYPNTLQINEKGQYASSKIANIAKINIGADKSKRSDFGSNKNPGPLDYPQKQLMGKIFDSRYSSSPVVSIHKRFEEKDSRNNYPGPGQYRAFSEFGIYESKNAKTEGNAPKAEKTVTRTEPNA